MRIPVIPAEAGIQYFSRAIHNLSRFSPERHFQPIMISQSIMI